MNVGRVRDRGRERKVLPDRVTYIHCCLDRERKRERKRGGGEGESERGREEGRKRKREMGEYRKLSKMKKCFKEEAGMT